MKLKKLIFIFLICLSSATILFAAEKTTKTVYKNHEIDKLLYDIEKPGQPLITTDYIIFTASPEYRYVGIAFDYENYKVVHPFQVLTGQDDEGKTYRKNLFYCYTRQHKSTTLKYRLVIDGLWTTDPLNPNKEYDDSVNLYFSKVEDPDSIRVFTTAQNDSTIRFIYKGESGLELHLAGTFTSWDPWIYQLEETSPGFYEISLPLPQGTYYYNYFLGLTPLLDETNPNKAYTKDGRIASVINVK